MIKQRDDELELELDGGELKPDVPGNEVSVQSDVLVPGELASQSPSEQPLPKNIYMRLKYINWFLTFSATFSLGLLAGLITHDRMSEQQYTKSAIITMDFISFFTAVAGKTAIMLFFNDATMLEGARKLYFRQLPSFFDVKSRSVVGNIAWLINCMVSINATVFWTLLVKLSFEESGQLLQNIGGGDSVEKLGVELTKPYFYAYFAICSLMTNFTAWPGVHEHAWHQRIEYAKWCLSTSTKNSVRNRRDELFAKSQAIMREIKQAINHPSMLTTPFLDQLLESLENQPSANYRPVNADETNVDIKTGPAVDKLRYLLTFSSQQLSQAYLDFPEINDSASASRRLSSFKRPVALAVTLSCIWGYRNVVGLYDVLTNDVGLGVVSAYGGGYVAFYSIAEVAFLAVYPMITGLFDVAEHGKMPQVYSNWYRAFAILVVVFIGGFGGLANAEQSQLDGESTINIVNSAVASFLLDAVAIYTILTNLFEDRVQNATTTPAIELKQLFLKFQSRQQEILGLAATDDLAHSSTTQDNRGTLQIAEGEDNLLGRRDSSSMAFHSL